MRKLNKNTCPCTIFPLPFFNFSDSIPFEGGNQNLLPSPPPFPLLKKGGVQTMVTQLYKCWFQKQKKHIKNLTSFQCIWSVFSSWLGLLSSFLLVPFVTGLISFLQILIMKYQLIVTFVFFHSDYSFPHIYIYIYIISKKLCDYQKLILLWLKKRIN